MEKYTVLREKKNKYFLYVNFPQSTSRSITIPIEVPGGFSVETDMWFLKFYRNAKDLKYSKQLCKRKCRKTYYLISSFPLK